MQQICVCVSQERKAEMTQDLLEVVEKATELETLLNDNLLRQQQELNQALGSADVESDRYHPLLMNCVHVHV